MFGNWFKGSAGSDVETLAGQFNELKLPQAVIDETLGPIAAAPKREEPWVEAAVGLRRRGYPRAAEKTYQVALRHFPKSNRLWGNQGVLLRDLGRYEESVRSLKQALAIKPDYEIAMHNLANTYELAQDFHAAAEWYDRAVKVARPLPQSWNGLANCLAALGYYEVAYDSYRRAIDADPDYAEPHFNWALQLLRQGKRREAINQLSEFLRRWPDDAQARALLEQLRDPAREAPVIHHAQPPQDRSLVVRAFDNIDRDGRHVAPTVDDGPAAMSFRDVGAMSREEAAAHGALGAHDRVELWQLIEETASTTQPPEYPRLFLSYRRQSPEHMEWLRRLARELDERGYDVMLDQFIQGQEQAPSVPELVSLIATCNVFVPVLTDGYFERINLGDGPVHAHKYLEDGWVFDEFQAALHLGQMQRLVVTGLWRSGRLHEPFTPDNVVDLRDDRLFPDALSRPFPRRKVMVVGVRPDSRVRSVGPLPFSQAMRLREELQASGDYDEVLVVSSLAD
jgi:tetratricopeptide (TPR) repeat protein